jgi:basic membrane protein A
MAGVRQFLPHPGIWPIYLFFSPHWRGFTWHRRPFLLPNREVIMNKHFYATSAHRSSRLVALIICVLIVPLLAACGAGSGGSAATATPPQSTATSAAAPLKVAMIAPNRIFDKGYMELAWSGVQLAEKELGAQVKPVEVLDNSLVIKNVDDLVNQGYTVIVMVSPQLRDLAIEAAKKYPQITFIGVDHAQDTVLPNLVGLIFNEDQAGYLAGALAASMSKTGKVGAVLGTDVIPQLWAFGEGFRKGAQDQKPGIEVTLVYHNQVPIEKSFIDPEWGSLQANAMLDNKIDVIFAAAGATGNGTLLAIADRKASGAMGIGVDTDQYTTLSDAQPILLSSSVKQVDQGILTILKQIKDGTVKGGNFRGSIGLAPFHDFESKIPADVKQSLSDLQQKLASGQLTIELPARPTP